MVLQADRANLGAGEAVSGATVFDGDRFWTRSGGTLRVGLGASQLYLLENSAVSLGQAGGRLRAAIARGTVVFSTTAGPGVELLADAARLRPVSPQLTVTQLTVLGPHALLVFSRRGALEVSLDGEVRTIPEGASYRVLLEPEAEPQGPQGVGAPNTPKQPAHPGKNKIIITILVADAVGTGIAVWRALVSPDKP